MRRFLAGSENKREIASEERATFFGAPTRGRPLARTVTRCGCSQRPSSRLRRMSEGETITAHDLRNYKTLDVSDEEFKFATILTPGNRERQEFNHIQAKRWARKHRTNVVRWPKRIREKNLERQTKKPGKCQTCHGRVLLLGNVCARGTRLSYFQHQHK